jgi:hypothetical protein
MSDLLKRQIDEAMDDVRERTRWTRQAIKAGVDSEDVDIEQYSRETQLIKMDCLRGLRWLENCKR